MLRCDIVFVRFVHNSCLQSQVGAVEQFGKDMFE